MIFFTHQELLLSNSKHLWLMCIQILLVIWYQIYKLSCICIFSQDQLTSNNFLFFISIYPKWNDCRFLDPLMFIRFNAFLRKENLIHSNSAIERRLGIFFVVFVVHLIFLKLESSYLFLKVYHCLISLIIKFFSTFFQMKRTWSAKFDDHQTILYLDIICKLWVHNYGCFNLLFWDIEAN